MDVVNVKPEDLDIQLPFVPKQRPAIRDNGNGTMTVVVMPEKEGPSSSPPQPIPPPSSARLVLILPVLSNVRHPGIELGAFARKANMLLHQ